MNKVMLGLILAVCVLGMLLVMLNERLGRKTTPEQPAVAERVTQEAERPTPFDSPQIAEILIQQEDAEARAALAPPRLEPAEPLSHTQVPEPEVDTVVASVVPTPSESPSIPRETSQDASPQASPPLVVPTETPAPAVMPIPAATRPAQEAPVPAPQVAPTQAPTSRSASTGNTITRFVVYSREKGATVRLGADKPIKYSSMTLENPDRVVVDLDGQWDFPPDPGIPRNDLVEHVRIGRNGDKTRVVIDLKAKPRQSRVVQSNNGSTVDVRVDL